MANDTTAPIGADPYKLVDLPTEYWEIGKIFPYDKNTKVHAPDKQAKLKASIKADGLFEALILDKDGVIIAGHGRFKALVDLGHVKVPVKYASHLSKNQADAARIAHNKTSSTDYHSDFMAEELKRLSEADDVDLQALGLDDHELDFLMEDLGEMDLDAISKALDEEVDQQDKDTADKVTATDASEERLGKVFGFNVIPIAAVKDVRRLIAQMESETGKTGQDAFVEWCRVRV